MLGFVWKIDAVCMLGVGWEYTDILYLETDQMDALLDQMIKS
jgi:hypothetical protein